MAIERWQINSNIGECKKFIFKGYDTTFNNFSTEDECQYHCILKKYYLNFKNSKCSIK